MKFGTEPQKILFVDDEPAILDSLSRGFRTTGYTLFTATGGAEALNIMQQHAISVIVADYSMPSMKGTELLGICRERWPDCVRIMLTGGGNLDIALSATFNGWVYQYVEKPVKVDELRAIIDEAIQFRERAYQPEYARLLFAPDAHANLLLHMRITTSPDRPTFAAHTSPLEWAVELCQANQLPPELDRFRPLIDILHQVCEIAGDSSLTDNEALSGIRALLEPIQ